MTARRRAALLVVLAAVLAAPLGSGLVPGPARPVLGERSATAQTPPPATSSTTTTTTTTVPASYVAGTPDPCPTVLAPGSTTPGTWRPQSTDPNFMTASECVLRLPACPVSPLNRNGFMHLSVPTDLSQMHITVPGGLGVVPLPAVSGLDLYPEFCEERVLQSDPGYAACMALTGYAVMPYTDGGVDGCRVLAPIACPLGMHRSGSQSCRAVRRRSWTCAAAGYQPSNAYNSCYLPAAAPDPAKKHPACDTGAPDFPIGSCAEYVANDFLRTPSAIVCATEYPINMPVLAGGHRFVIRDNSRSGSSASHWCEFDAAALRTDCHRTDGTATGCTAEPAACLKRVSRTGGCDRIATTINCRAHQAALAQGSQTAAGVRAAGCDPCASLPFSAATRHCPRFAVGRADDSRRRRREKILRIALEWPHETGEAITEADYAEGDCSMIETAKYLAGSACKNKPVCSDPPRGRLSYVSQHHSGLAVVNSPVVVTIDEIPVRTVREPTLGFSGSSFFAGGRDNLHYADAASDDRVPRVKTFRPADPGGRYTGAAALVYDSARGGECTGGRLPPLFTVVVRELWPGNLADHSRIRALFGATALDWWDRLNTSQQQDRTAARGLVWHLTATDSEKRANARLLATEVQCARGGWRTCDWFPSRSGYFELTGVGAWEMTVWRPRSWKSQSQLTQLRTALSGSAKQDQARQELAKTGPPQLKAADVGLADNFSSYRPLEGDREVLFTAALAGTAACGATDLRVACSSGTVAHVTETEPVGVIVHEIRTQTVAVPRS